MKVLVTGATGFIGLEVAKLLSENGVKPRLLVRRRERGTLLSRLDAEIVQGDLESYKSLLRATDGVDAVIHLAARATFENYRQLKKTNVDGSVDLMHASIESGVKNFIFSSSMLVYSSSDEFIDKDTIARPTVDYGKAKLETEHKLQKLAEKANINFLSMRLPHVYGPQDLMFNQLKKNYFILPNTGENLFSHLHVEDCGRLIVKAAESKINGIYPVADESPRSWNEFFFILDEYYPSFKLIKIPERLSLLFMNIVNPINIIRNKPSLYTPDTIKGFSLNLKVKPGVLWDELGIKPKYKTIDEGIPATLDGYVAYRWKNPIFD